MKQLVYCNINKKMMLDGITKYCIIIKDPHEFYRIIDLLNKQVSTKADGFVLSDASTDKILSLGDNSDILIDYFNMEFNNRKIQNLLYKKATETIHNSSLNEEYIKSIDMLNSFMTDVVKQLDIMTAASDTINLEDILKLTDLKILEWYKTPLEMIVNYIDILYKLRNIDVLFLVNVKQILNEEEIKELYSHCSYLKLNLVLIESTKSDKKLPDESIIEIDKDLCEVDY